MLYAIAHQLYWAFKSIDEGRVRTHRDKALYEKLRREVPKARLTLEQGANLKSQVEAEVRSGGVSKRKKKERLRQIEDALLVEIQAAILDDAAEKSTRTLRRPGEPEIIDDLLKARTPKEIEEISKDAATTRRMQVAPELEKEVPVLNWPISPLSILPNTLSKFAVEFIAAKNDPRFPRSSRPTNRLKQLWFLSRALAGAVHGISTRTAINLIGARRPDQMAEFSKGKRQPKKIRPKAL